MYLIITLGILFLLLLTIHDRPWRSPNDQKEFFRNQIGRSSWYYPFYFRPYYYRDYTEIEDPYYAPGYQTFLNDYPYYQSRKKSK